MPKTLLLLSLVTLLCFPLRAQQPYLLFHKSNTREAQYFAGEVIAFRIKDGLVLFDGYEVHPNDFEVLYTDQKTRAWFAFGYKFVKLTMIAGAGYLALDVINTGRFDKNTMIISGSLIGAGLIGRLFIREKFKIKGKKKMVVIE